MTFLLQYCIINKLGILTATIFFFINILNSILQIIPYDGGALSSPYVPQIAISEASLLKCSIASCGSHELD